MNKVNRIGMVRVAEYFPVLENGYISAEDIIQFHKKIVEDMVTHQLAYEKLMIDSLVHFCNTGSFLPEEE